MPFLVKNFTNIGGQARRGNAPMAFAYSTSDTLTAVVAAGYFNNAWDKLLPGDTIHVSVVTFGTDTMPGAGANEGKPTACSAFGIVRVTAVSESAKTVTVAS